MENIKSHSRRDFLRSSALAGGGLMLSVSWFAEAKAPEKTSTSNIAEQWNELTAYIKITPDNVVKILCPNPEFGQNHGDITTWQPFAGSQRTGVGWCLVHQPAPPAS